MPLLYGDADTTADVVHVPDAPRGHRDRAGNVPAVRDEARPGTDVLRVSDAPDVTPTPTCPSADEARPRTDVDVCPMHPTSRDEPNVPEVRDAARPIERRDHRPRRTTPGHGHAHAHDAADGLEWEDLMPEINAASNAHNMIWKLVDLDTGKENWEIDWEFRVGDLVKIRLVNDMDQDHPMHHPFHIHGAGRFLILARDGVVEPNLAWKDTVLVRSGETVDILLDVTNPGCGWRTATSPSTTRAG